MTRTSVLCGTNSANKNVTRNGVAHYGWKRHGAYVYLLSATDFSYGAGALLHFRRAGWLQRHYFQLQHRTKDHHLFDRRAEEYRQQLYRFTGDHVVNRGFA